MDELELSKFFTFEPIQIKRSEIHFADYNPRTIGEEERKALKKDIKRFGIVGGIIVNKTTSNTLVQGHQRVSVIDELQKYNPETQENDYVLRVDAIEVDEKSEKELAILLNNPNVQGRYDYDKLREIFPDIDYKAAGLTDADLSMIGVDFIFQTEEENNLLGEFESMMSEANEEHRQEVERRAEERERQKEAIKAAQEESHAMENAFDGPTEEERIQHMKDVKKDVKEKAMQKAGDMDAYLMISFTDFAAKSAFCDRFGYDQYTKFVKGEEFEARLDGALDDGLYGEEDYDPDDLR